ncbi:trichothecene 3-o-acetyltransferase [Paramyrothecium foliicola]|nr:trichothecene 3-o-acetyltransferase [Paramyrothecium foliicola]
MVAPKPTLEFDILLDVFGQCLITIFTQICFCFKTDDAAEDEELLRTLKQGLARLAHHFPWVTGQVVCENAGVGNTGVFRIQPLEVTPRLTVKDYRGDASVPSMEEMRRGGFPMNALDERIVAPRSSNSGRPGETIAEVFQLQVSLIKGGLLLTFLGQHQSMDGVGQAQVIRLFSKACRGETFTEEELRIGNYAPENTVPLLGNEWTPGSELTYNIYKDDPLALGPGSGKTVLPSGDQVWAQFNFSADALEALKSEAIRTLPAESTYISTDDALSAFAWQSITRARRTRFDPTTPTKLTRAVDLRRYLNIPAKHPGFLQCMTYHDSTMTRTVEAQLGAIAADLRTAVEPSSSELEYYARSLATLISRMPDKNGTSFIAGFDMSKDVMLSSWAKQDSYELDFGLGLGNPEAVRRPRFDGLQGLGYLLPKAPNGDIGLAMCLSTADMENLRRDKEFARYATYIG